MAEPAQGMLSQLANLWRGQGRRTRLLAAFGLGAVALGGLYFALHSPRLSYSVLFSGLSLEDAGEVAAKLQELHAPYQLTAGGTAISVPDSQVHELRIATAADGLPRGGGVGFEIFDEQTFGTSRFVEELNYRRALEGELARTVGALDVVESARVHIAMPQNTVFSDKEQAPSASVVVRLHKGRGLAPEQVQAIAHLVAASVDRLSVERVTVVDDRGTLLSKQNSQSDDNDANGGKEIELNLAQRIKTILEKAVGKDAVEVTVTAEFDRRAVDETEELYDPAKVAVRSETRTVEGAGAAAAAPAATTEGIAGARGNLPGTDTAPATGGKTDGRLSEARTYEVSKVVRRTVEPVQRIVRLHVGIIVDSGRQKNGAPIARTKEELAQLEALARQAGGLDTARGDTLEIRNIAFAPPPPEVALAAVVHPFGLPVPLPVAAGGAGGLVFLLIVGILVLKMKRRPSAEPALVLPARVHELEAAIGEQKRWQLGSRELNQFHKGLVDRVHELVKQDSARAARVITAWTNDGQTAAKERAD